MGYYFEDHQSMFAQVGMQVQRTLDAITRRYVGNNPPHPITFRAYSKRGILRGKDYRYEADFSRFFPAAKLEHFVYGWARYWCDAPTSLMFDVTCLGPLVIYCNGKEIFKSNIFSERYADARHRVAIALQAGWNHFVIRCKKNRAGFGMIFGSWLGKHPCCFMMPGHERARQEGWLFTDPIPAELPVLPGAGMSERATGLRGHPETAWGKGELKTAQLQRIYGHSPGAFAVGWTKAFFMRPGTGRYVLRGRHHGPIH